MDLTNPFERNRAKRLWSDPASTMPAENTDKRAMNAGLRPSSSIAGDSREIRPNGRPENKEMGMHMTFKKSALVASMAMAAVFGIAANTSAATAWQNHHPRRAEVNHRLAVQNARIRDEVREGDLTKEQAQTLHAEDRAILQQERLDASRHDGHITKAEQRALNQEENAVSKQIGE